MRGESLYSLLLFCGSGRQLCNCRFLLSYFTLFFKECLVLFQKLVEQHRVDGLVAHAVGLTLLVANDQSRVDRFYVFSHESKLRDGVWVFLIMKGDRSQREDRVASVIHRSNIVFKAPRGRSGTQLTVRVNKYLRSS